VSFAERVQKLNLAKVTSPDLWVCDMSYAKLAVFCLSIPPQQSFLSSSLQSPFVFPTYICGMATFFDLPTELLLKIIHLEDSTHSDAIITRLGMTCRRLHSICKVPVLERQLPIMHALVRRGRLVIFKNSGSVAMKAEELQDVNNIFEASFDKFEYIFEHFTTQEVGSVHALIFYAHSIRDITIKLGPYSTYIDWYKPLAMLIRISSEKGQSDFTITGTPHYGQGFRIFVPPASFLGDCLSRLGFSYPRKAYLSTRTTQSGIIIPMGKEKLPYANVNFDIDQGIKGFYINSPLPFYEACFPLTLRILNGRCIRKLCLSNPGSGISDWRNILPLISMPLLLEFCVGCGYIAFNDLSLFLRRHPNVTHLDLYCTISTGQKIMFPILWEFLPRLEAFRGTPDNVLMLLSRGKRSFPMLRSVSLTLCSRKTVQEEQVIDGILRKLAHYHRATIHLCIHLLHPIDFSEWFSEKNSKPHSLESVKKLEINMYGIPMSPEAFFFRVSNYKFLFVQELWLKDIASPDPGIWTEQLNGWWDSCPDLH
jgi:hypothetical protein